MPSMTTSLPSTSALPALMAAMAVLRDHASPQRLHTYGDCLFYLVPEMPGAPAEAARTSACTDSQATSSSRKCVAVSVVSSDSDGEDSGTSAPLNAEPASPTDACDRASSSPTFPTVHICFTHAIPYAQLNQFANLHHELRTAFRAVGPHCTYSGGPPASRLRADAACSISVRSDVTPQERSAVLAFAADLRLHALLPVVAGVLERSTSSEQQEFLTLLPDSTGRCTSAATPSNSAACVSGAALYVCATPTPSSARDAARAPAHEAASRPFFDGTVALTVCVTAADAADAALVRRYLNAFAEVERAPVMLHVRESTDPPRHVRAPPRLPHAHTAPSTRAAMDKKAEYVWWCTFVLAPHQLVSVCGLRQGLRWALDLRLSLLHHVHQERTAMRARLREQLRTYAAYFD